MSLDDLTAAGAPMSPVRLGYGLAELFRLSSAAARRRLLDAAFDAGIRHFDVAPMYGLGAAERELGGFTRGRRDQVVIATKFGIGVTGVGRLLGRVQGPIRRGLEASPGMRGRARRGAAGPGAGPAGSVLYTAVGYGAATARASLERSLRVLNTDRLDLFLLHDPTPGSVDADGVGEYLEHARTEGLIGAWGIAGEPAEVLGVAERLDRSPRVVQLRDDIFERSLERVPRSLPATRITFGSLGSALMRISDHLARDRQARERWTRRVGADCGDPEVVAGLLLRDARLRNPAGITLFSSIRSDRLRRAVAAVSSPDMDEAVAALTELVETELAGASVPGPGR